MAENTISTCLLCKNLSEDPRMLPCAHSFCLKCLESSSTLSEDPKCPDCSLAFQIPKGGLENLKKNEFLECYNKFSINERNCGGCSDSRAVAFCVDCTLYYCSTCLQNHGKDLYLKNHRLYGKEHETGAISSPKKHEICKDHNEIINFYCEDCNAYTCETCKSEKHDAHQMKSISDKFDEIEDYLDLKIKTKEVEFKNVTISFKRSKKMLRDCKTKAGEMKKEIHERGEYIKKLVDTIVAEMSEEIDKELKQHEDKIEDVMTKLKEIQTDLNVHIETLKQELMNLNYDNISENSFDELDDKLVIPPCYNSFKMSITTCNVDKMASLKEMIGFIQRRTEPLKILNFDVPFDVMKFKDDSTSFAVDNDMIYICSGHKINIYNVSGFVHKYCIIMDRLVASFIDVEVIDGSIFISGGTFISGKKITNIYGIFKIEINDDYSFKGLEKIYLINKPFSGRLSKTTTGLLIVSVNKQILLFSQDGCILKEIVCPIGVRHCVQLNDNHFVICWNSDICIIDQNGFIISKYSSDDKIRCVDYLTVDKHQNIYGFNSNENKVFVFDQNVNLVNFLNIKETLLKIYHNSHRNLLMVLTINCLRMFKT